MAIVPVDLSLTVFTRQHLRMYGKHGLSFMDVQHRTIIYSPLLMEKTGACFGDHKCGLRRNLTPTLHINMISKRVDQGNLSLNFILLLSIMQMLMALRNQDNLYLRREMK